MKDESRIKNNQLTKPVTVTPLQAPATSPGLAHNKKQNPDIIETEVGTGKIQPSWWDGFPVRIRVAMSTISKLDPFSAITNPEIVSPFIRQFLGFNVGSVFMIIVAFACLALLRFKLLESTKRNILLLSAACFLLTFLPSFIARYLLTPAFTYFFQSLFFLTIIAALGVSEIKNGYLAEDKCKSAQVFVDFISLIICQNILFIRPQNMLHNPTYAIAKNLGYSANTYPESLYNLRAAAKVINEETDSGDTVLLSDFAITPYLKARHVQGTEMNLFDDFFGGSHRMFLKDINEGSSSMGVRPLYVVRLLRDKKVAMIIDRGKYHPDLLKAMKGIYCFTKEVYGYRLYAPCDT